MTKQPTTPNTNMALWQSVEKTDPDQTKKITGKAYQGTSPKPYYLIKKATETFGPCGIGWGFIVLNERVEEGAGGERVHIAHVRVWYVWNDKRGEVEHVGGTAFSGTRGSGKNYSDEDAPKKSVTDALVKALSLIGFAGDIFAGLYDDDKYVAALRAEDEEDHAPRNITGRVGYIALAKSAIKNAKAADDLRSWWADEKANRRDNGLTQADVDDLKNMVVDRSDELSLTTEPA